MKQNKKHFSFFIQSGGGVGLYIKENMSFNVRHDLEKIDESIEILWIEVQG